VTLGDRNCLFPIAEDMVLWEWCPWRLNFPIDHDGGFGSDQPYSCFSGTIVSHDLIASQTPSVPRQGITYSVRLMIRFLVVPSSKAVFAFQRIERE
jgi:hypothetical protein